MKKRIFGFLKSTLLFIAIFICLNLIVTFFFRFVDPASTAFMYLNIEEPFSSLFRSDDISYLPTSINKVSFYVPLALISSEDQTFFDHFGFDFQQIEKALKENKYRKRKRGASTITMQVAKNLFLWSERDLLRKGFEAYYSLLLELLWSKKRIIETYQNIAEMGKGIYGIKAASRKYYGKSPSKISISQAATLAAIIPNPKKRNPVKPSRYVIARRGDIINQMNLIGGIQFIRKELE
jgi:monofunctional biosynthetic peptidoglycan transglycosylase